MNNWLAGSKKALSLTSPDGWDYILNGDDKDRGAWGSAYFKAIVLKRAAMTRAIQRRVISKGGGEIKEDKLPFKIKGGFMDGAPIEVDQIVALAKKLFVKESLNLAVIGPFKDEGEFDKILLN